MSEDACVPVTRVPPETCVFPLPPLPEGFALLMLTHHPSDHYLHVGSLLLINTQEYVPLALVTLLIES